MVENILATLVSLKGVQHACLYREDKGLISSFPKNNQKTEALAQKIDQIFAALQATGKSHNELYFSVESNLLAAYLMYDSYIAILLTDKNINFPLVRMGIRSASLKIAHHLELISEKGNPLAEKNNISSFIKDKKILRNGSASANKELESILKKIFEELNNYFGSATKFIFEDALVQWEVHYVISCDNIPELCKILIKEMRTIKEKEAFSQFVNRILR
ncbi:MAG: hypothetical protein KAH20_06960 [Methylococcales bacterium]|nr:hypothetical protein [Methylococcales bacterium]